MKQESSWIFTKLNRNRKDSETDKEAKKSLWPERVIRVEAGAGRPIFAWESKRCKERERGFENLAPSLAFSQDWSQDLNCFSSIVRCWTGISLNEMLQRGRPSDWFTKQALGETEDSRDSFPSHDWGAEQSSLRASQLLFTGRIRLARTRPNLTLLQKANLYVYTNP